MIALCNKGFKYPPPLQMLKQSIKLQNEVLKQTYALTNISLSYNRIHLAITTGSGGLSALTPPPPTKKEKKSDTHKGNENNCKHFFLRFVKKWLPSLLINYPGYGPFSHI